MGLLPRIRAEMDKLLTSVLAGRGFQSIPSRRLQPQDSPDKPDREETTAPTPGPKHPSLFLCWCEVIKHLASDSAESSVYIYCLESSFPHCQTQGIFPYFFKQSQLCIKGCLLLLAQHCEVFCQSNPSSIFVIHLSPSSPRTLTEKTQPKRTSQSKTKTHTRKKTHHEQNRANTTKQQGFRLLWWSSG